MELLRPDLNLDRFFAELKNASQSLLMLDYDGTLAPFRPERDRAVPYEGVQERLERLVPTPKTRVVIISGRWTRELLPLLNLSRTPEIWGCHGAERLLPDGHHEVVALPAKAEQLLAQVENWTKQQGYTEHLERKPTAVALHWRGLPTSTAKAMAEAFAATWQPRVGEAGLELHSFDGGIEIRLSGRHKGQAVAALLSQISSDSPAAYLGDDLTDEDAFAALGDRGLKVLVRTEPRETAADLRLVPPEELLSFLDRWLEVSEP